MIVSDTRTSILNALVGIKVMDDSTRAEFLAEPTKDIALVELGIDSISVMDFCLLIENDIGREIEIFELVDNPSLNILAAHLAGS
jgi:acyl carrier protein